MPIHRRLLQFVSSIVILTMLFSGFPLLSASAQGKDGVKRQVNAQTGKVSFIGPENGRSLSASRALGTFIRPQNPGMALAKRFGSEFGLKNPERDLKEMKTHHADNGRLSVRYQQKYQDIPVMGGELIVNTNDNGDLYSMNGEVSPNLSLSTQPTVSSEQAKETALQAVAKWYSKTSEDFVTSEPELWIYDESLLQPSTRPAELVWRMEVTPKDIGMPVRELVLVNAQRGEISLHFNQIDNAWLPSSETSIAQDTQPTPTPAPIETPLPTETLEPVVTEIPIEEPKPDQNVAFPNASIGEVTTLAGATWYVATTGNDSNSCSSTASPCKTINGAIGKAANGDTIKVSEGTYTGTGSYVVSISNNLLLSGGWDPTFSAQSSLSIIDGQNARQGIYNTSTNTTIDHLIVQNGYTTFGGGGIYNYITGSLTINNSLIINNMSTNGGGGVYSEGNLNINNTTIEANSSSYDGGGIEIYLSSGSLTLNNSTIANNQAYRLGGAIALDYSSGGSAPGTITIQNSTLVNNSAQTGGGISNGGGSSRAVNIANSIIAKNTASARPDCSGNVTSSNHNIIGNNGGCTITAGAGDKFNVDPQLLIGPSGALHYFALLSNSPAVDAGENCLPTDQKGTSRPQGMACDIGAYEYTTQGSASSFGVANGSDQRTGGLVPFPLPLIIYVIDNFGNPVSGVSVTFIAPQTGASGTFADTSTNTTTIITDTTGRAISSIFTANSQLGTYKVRATIPNLPGSAEFTLTNADLFVSPTGSDSNSCDSAVLPCRTINGAIIKAIGGELIRVAIGTYTGNVSPIVKVTKNLTLSGGWENSFNSQTGISIIDGNAKAYHGVTLNTSGHVTISGFKIQNSYFGIENDGSILSLDKVASVNNVSGLRNIGGKVTITNTTISGNTGGMYTGSAIYSVLGNINIQYSTITNNVPNPYAIWIDQANIEVGNSIISGNSNENCGISLSVMTSDGYNIFGSSCVNYSSSINLFPTDRIGVNPKLLPLISAGYHPILSDSPSYNSANASTCPAADQRGILRPVGAKCDIGSFEYRGGGTTAAYIFAYEGTPQNIVIGSINRLTWKVVVLDNNGDGVSGVTVTFNAPVSGASGVFTNTNTNVATSITDASGIATSPPFKANTITGGYTINAVVSVLAATAQFQITNITPAVKTYTAGNSPSLPGSLLCDGIITSCTNGSNPRADSAHKYALGTYSFYAAQFKRDSIDNKGMTIISTVDYCDPDFPCPYDNAFWNGEQMVYGNAHGYALADDVVAHELTHGVTQYESGLFPYYQSGAIDESFSDLWGEYYDQTNGLGNDAAGVRWQIGEDVSGLSPIRSMSNPPIYGDPDKISSSNYRKDAADSGGVHHNSGVNNKAVFLMVDGGTFNGKTVTALGWGKTAAIYYEVNTNLLSSGADYSDLYYALQQACASLIGQEGITAGDCVEVKDAIDAVDMNAQPAPNFNTDAPICSAGYMPLIVFADDLETGTSNWTFNNGTYPRWQWDSPYGPFAQSGVHSLYADDYPDTVTDATARLVSFVIPNNAYLRFAQAYDFETSDAFYDGGVLEYSINNGSTWVDAGSLIDSNGYKGTIFPGYSNPSFNNPLKGRSAFVGSSHGYISTRLNLASLAGKTVTFRWRMGLDIAVYAWGWWVDNLKVYTCSVPPPGAFNKTAPTNNGTGIGLSPTLSWGSSTSADYYQYCYDIINDNQCNRTWNSVSGTSVGISNLGTNTTYYWQVRAVNAGGSTNANNQTWSSFTTTSTLPAGTASINTLVGVTTQGKYSLGSGQSLRESYSSVNNGPVKIISTNAIPLIAAERVIYKVNNLNTSFTEMMGLPNGQLDNTYWLPWYNNVDLDTQLRFGNVSGSTATVHVLIGGVEMTGSPFTLAPGESTRQSFAINNGPVQIVSNVNIVAAERVIYKVNGINTSFSELMALPNGQLDNTYWLPWYNNIDLDTQLRFANVSNSTATVHVLIGGVEMNGSPFTLLPGASTRQSFAINNGPVQIVSDQNIVAAERVIYKVNNLNTSFSELMALPNGQLDTTYWLPWYNNADLDTQLRFANVSNSTATVHVFIGGMEMAGSPFILSAGQSTRQSFAVNNGPVQIVSDQNIVAAERVIYKVNNINTSFSEMMAMPNSQLDTTYWLPWYNNVDLDTQLRFGVP